MRKEMDMAATRRGGALLPGLVAILAVAVGVQSYFLYKIYQRTEAGDAVRSEGRVVDPGKSASVQAPQSPPSPPTSGWATSDPFALLDSWAQDWDAWDPFSEMERMREQMDRMFQATFNRLRLSAKNVLSESFTFSPQMDLSEEGDEYVVRFDLPGLDKSKVSVKLEDRLLTVLGSTTESREQKQAGRVIRMERRSGRFSRSITLPGPVRAEGMKAEYENGVLTVRVPKAERAAEQKTITL